MNLLEGVSKLSKLLRQGLLDTNAKIFFDIDGVLAPYEFGIFHIVLTMKNGMRW